MRKCVILGSHIPTIDKIWIGEEIFQLIKKNLGYCDIFVGINPSNCLDEWINIVKKYTDKYEITPNELIINSDASSHQSALRLYKNFIDNYDLIYFLHTQGTKSNRHDVRNKHLDCLLIQNKKVEFIFENEVDVGAYGNTLTPMPYCWQESEMDFYLERFGVKFKNTPIRCFFVGTMFVMRGHILNYFLKNCNDTFFNKILYNKHTGKQGDPWFFERDFIHIVDAFHDYTLKGNNIINNGYPGIPLNGMTDLDHYNKLLNNWKEKNKLI